MVFVASCLAEGNARGPIKDYVRILSMPAGTLAGVEAQALLACRLGYFDDADGTKPRMAIHSSTRSIQALKKALVRWQETPCSPFPAHRSPH
ncbi:hypothetical protein [Dyella choica]|uniref:hypothetical protein n=1 Tax=Dyella choica TaxID=1927959 RepID=UPI0013158B77